MDFKTKNKIEAQRRYCENKQQIMFLPEDAKCYKCGKNVVEHLSFATCAIKLITGCQYCGNSFCE
jgi:hypothetical protein